MSAYLNLGGTVRCQAIETTIAFLKPQLKKLGITRVANVTGLDCLDVPVAISIRPNSKHLSVSQGKGLSWELAMVSAVMESIEGYHAENPCAPHLQGSYIELNQQYPVIHPKLFNAGFFILPQLENYAMPWIAATNIVTQQKVFIPHILICLDSTQPHPEYSFLSVSSNGLAAGNSLDEAICHGIYEIIERDALSRWAKFEEAARNASQIQLDSIDSTLNQSLLTQFTRCNQLIKIWDITSAIGIPTFHCALRDADQFRSLGLFRGTGTHLNKEIALARALTEAAQSRLTLISGSRDDVFSDHYQQCTQFNYSASDYSGQKNYQTCAQPTITANFASNRDYLLQQLTAQNFHHVFVVNHTKPEFNIPVVHVFIPGMEFNGTRI